MSEELNYKIQSNGDCLSEKMMFDYIDNRLSPKERHFVEKHMLDCELCADAMEGLELVKDRTRIGSLRTAVEAAANPKKEAKVVTFNTRTIISVAAAIALFVVGIFFFNQASKSMKEDSMAELKQTEQSPAPPIANTPVADEEAPAASQAESGGKADKKALPDEKTPVFEREIATAKQEDADLKANMQTEADREDNAPGAGDATGYVDQTISMDDRNKDIASTTPAPEESVAKPSVAASGENRKAKDEAEKKVSEQNNLDNVYFSTATGSTATPDQNQPVTGTFELSKNEDLAKESAEKSGKYRSEGKLKEKDKSKSPQKSRSNANSVAGTVAYEPQSVTEDKEEEQKAEYKKSQKTDTKTTVTDSLAAGETVYTIVDDMPEYPGGNEAMMKYFRDNLSFPPTDSDGTVIGTWIIEFVVKSNGKAVNAKVVKPADTAFEKQVIATVSKMPLWKAGKKDGKAVAVRFVLPVKINVK